MILIRILLALVASAAGICCFLGTVVALVPGAALVPEHGEELLRFQLQGVTIAVVSFVVLAIVVSVIEKIDP